VDIWRESQGNQTGIYGVADTVIKHFILNNILEKITKKPKRNSRRHRGKYPFTRCHNLENLHGAESFLNS
jgi:hypothetical protein